MCARECSRPRWGLQAKSLLIALLVAGAPLGAQTSTLLHDADFLGEPAGGALGKLKSGATVRRQEGRAGYTRVVVEGFVESSLLGGKSGKYKLTVKSASGALLRAASQSDGAVRAQLRSGLGLALVVRSGEWVKVRRGGWVATSAFSKGDPKKRAAARETASPPPASRPPATPAPLPSRVATAPPPAGATAGSAAPPVAPTARPSGSQAVVATPASGGAASPPEGSLVPTKPLELRESPGGSSLGSLKTGSLVTPLARERGWVRVRIEGWVPDGDLAPADTALQTAISAADLRADPAGTRGRVVRWEVEVLSFQTADPLRKDLTPDEPYLLARGPSRENALLYLALPPSLVTMAKTLAPLSSVRITARVRTGRSDPIGVPVLDIMSLTKK